MNHKILESDLKNIKDYIHSLEKITDYFKSLLAEESKPPGTEEEKLAELTDLRLLSKTETWPVAIDPTLVGNPENENDKTDRAEGIIYDFVKTSLYNKKFLDYGCGEGHVAHQAKECGATLSVGYDIAEQWKFGSTKQLIFTKNKNEIVEKFDIILINDVLDHADSPIEILKHAKSLNQGKIFVRCHPWSSRHGTHLYHKLNKAYLHLVFTDQELLTMGLKNMQTYKLTDPIASYKNWFREAGLTVKKESMTTQPVENFFITKSSIARRIKERWGNEEFPHKILSIQFADFVLS